MQSLFGQCPFEPGDNFRGASLIGSITVTEMVDVLGTLYCMGGQEKVFAKKKNLNFSRNLKKKVSHKSTASVECREKCREFV